MNFRPRPLPRVSAGLIVSAFLLFVAPRSSVASVLRSPNRITAFLGSTPKMDGVLDPAEWADATSVSGIDLWNPEFSPVVPPAPGAPADLDVTIFVKHDGVFFYLGLNVTDDFLYGFDGPRWTPAGNPSANNLTREGWPWFGDESELLINSLGTWSADNQTVIGDGTSWQMVVNLGKSRLGGIGVGGLMEGEPRSSDYAWYNYQNWILNGSQVAATSRYPQAAPGGGSYYSIEWAVRFDPCFELSPGVYYNASSGATAVVGMNVALGDVDTPEEGDPTYGLRHEMWWNGSSTCAGGGNCHTLLFEFGELAIVPTPNPARVQDGGSI